MERKFCAGDITSDLGTTCLKCQTIRSAILSDARFMELLYQNDDDDDRGGSDGDDDDDDDHDKDA